MNKVSKLIAVIPKKRIKQFPLLIVAMIGAALEVLGIGLIPLMEIITGNGKHFLGQLSPSYFQNFSQHKLIVFSVSVFTLAYILKAIYLILLAWFFGRFSYTTKAEITNLLMRRYVDAPFEFHLQKNSAQLIRNLTAESNQLAANVLNPILVISSESLLLSPYACSY